MAAASDALPPALRVLQELLDLRDVDGDRPTDPHGTTLGLVGGTASPRFLLPLDRPAATTAACLRYNGLRPARTRLNRGIVAVAARAGLERIASPRYRAADGEGTFLHHLATVLGVADLQVAVGVGNHDAVWKPTLQCFSPDGTPVAYVKVGLGPVGATLVRTEADALERWQQHDDPRLLVPAPLAVTEWDGHPVVCTEPMPADVRRVPAGTISPLPVRALDDPLPDAPLADASWWTSRVGHHADDPEVAGVLARIEARHAGPSRSWARWHGDWVPWNMARCSRGLVVWDWEYSEPGAPVGLDEAHAAYQVSRVGKGRSVVDALAAARRAAPDAWVADAHLAMLVTRNARLHELSGSYARDHHEVLAATRALTGPSAAP